MRPFPVLVLVFAAIAALVIALFLMPSSMVTTTTAPAGVGPGGVQPEAASTPPQELRPAGERQTAPRPAPTERTAATPAPTETRATVANVVGAWSNALRVKVLDPDGASLSGARVEIREDAGNLLGELLTLAQPQQQRAGSTSGATDANGEYRFQNIAPGRYAVSATHASFARGEVGGIEVSETGEIEARVVLGRGLVLEGRVMDQHGNPIPDATLTLIPSLFYNLAPDHPVHVSRAIRAQTDANGNYRLQRLETGSHSLTASAPGYGSRTQQNILVLEREGAPQAAQDFRLDPEFRIGGHVFASNRAPVADAEILAVNYASAQTSTGRARSAADGSFELGGLAPGVYQLIARAQGHKEERVMRVDAGDMNVRIELPELGGASGRVTSAAGQPVTSFEVHVRRALPQSAMEFGRVERRETVRSDSGEFQIGGLDEGEFIVEIEAPDHARTRSERFRVQQGIITAGVDVTVTRGGTLVGRVVDARTGEPVSGARVSTRDATHVSNPFTDMFRDIQPRNTTDRTVRTDASGRYRMELLTPGKYLLEIEHTGLVTQFVRELTVHDGQETAVPDARLSSGGIVRGMVTDSTGAPLAGAKVTLIGTTGSPHYSENTDAAGRYTIRRIAAGQYRIHAQRPSGPGGNPADIFSPIIDVESTKREIFISEGAELSFDFAIDRS